MIVTLLAGWVAPSVSARTAARELVYTDGSTIMFVRADGTGHRVVETPANGLPSQRHSINSVSWGPRGEQLVYSKVWCILPVCAPRTGEIRVMDADGTRHRTVVAISDAVVSGARWSPDGRRIAFLTWHWVPCWGCPAASVVHIVNADGSTHLTLGPGYRPEWSPDGRRLAYSTGTGAIAVVDVALGDPPSIVSPPQVLGSSPVWSPDGRYIAFFGNDAADDGGRLLPAKVWVVTAEGKRARALPVSTYAPVSWSPDSRQLAVASTDDGHIAIVDRLGDRTRHVTSSGFPLSVAWSQGGSTIAYVHYENGRHSLRTISPSGSGRRTLASPTDWITAEISWSP